MWRGDIDQPHPLHNLPFPIGRHHRRLLLWPLLNGKMRKATDPANGHGGLLEYHIVHPLSFIIADDMEDIRVLEFIYAAVRPPALAAGI